MMPMIQRSENLCFPLKSNHAGVGSEPTSMRIPWPRPLRTIDARTALDDNAAAFRTFVEE